MAVIQWGMGYPHQLKIHKSVSNFLYEALSTDQQWCGKIQLSNQPQKVQHLINILGKQVT